MARDSQEQRWRADIQKRLVQQQTGKKPSWGWTPWVPWLFVLFGLVLLVIDIFSMTSFLQQKTTLVVPGKILQISQSQSSYNLECNVTYQFFLHGKQIKGIFNAPSCPFYYQAGDTAPIAYSSTDPATVQIIPPGGAFWGLVRTFLPILLFSIIFSTFWTLLTGFLSGDWTFWPWAS